VAAVPVVAPPGDDRAPEPANDPLRGQLLAAAGRVFASKGYDGTKIMDIVRESGLSSGAAYGRFASKDELLLEAVLVAVEEHSIARRLDGRTVAEMLAEASRADDPLDDHEAMELEAFIAARRHPTLADALTDARAGWRETLVAPLIEQASKDGSASPDADFDSLVYLLQTLHLGLLVQRGAGQHAPDGDAWERFIERLLRSMAHPDTTAD
jgi:AcrR family transcriptional regulator